MNDSLMGRLMGRIAKVVQGRRPLGRRRQPALAANLVPALPRRDNDSHQGRMCR